MFPNTDGGFINASITTTGLLKPLADSLGIPKLNGLKQWEKPEVINTDKAGVANARREYT